MLLGQDCVFKRSGYVPQAAWELLGQEESFCPGVGEIWVGCRAWMELALEFVGRDRALPQGHLPCVQPGCLPLFSQCFLSLLKTDGDVQN